MKKIVYEIFHLKYMDIFISHFPKPSEVHDLRKCPSEVRGL